MNDVMMVIGKLGYLIGIYVTGWTRGRIGKIHMQ
jgi:hypothetical protein